MHWLSCFEIPSVTPADRKKFRDRATRAVREFEKERSKYGVVDDGAGRRYRIGVYFLLAGELKRAADAFDWFYREFPDDMGEPVFFLYSALAAYRSGEMDKAHSRLLEAMLSNIFLLPFLVGKKIEVTGVWLSSNREHASHLAEIDEYLQEPSLEERDWIAQALETDAFVTLRDGYIETFSALSGERDLAKRRRILDRWRDLRMLNLPSPC